MNGRPPPEANIVGAIAGVATSLVLAHFTGLHLVINLGLAMAAALVAHVLVRRAMTER